MFAIRCLFVIVLLSVASSPVIVQGFLTTRVCVCDPTRRSLLVTGTRFLCGVPEEVCACLAIKAADGSPADVPFSECCDSGNPTANPTLNPTAAPTADPTLNPTANPTANPTGAPTMNPTTSPTANPTAAIPNGPQKGSFELFLEILAALLRLLRSLFGSNNRRLSENADITAVKQVRPVIQSANNIDEQVRPASQPVFNGESVLLAENIGLWGFPTFLNEEEIEELLAAVEAAEAHSYDCKQDFCELRAHDTRCIDKPDYKSKIQPNGKSCLSLVDGALSLMDNSDQDAWRMLHKKTADLWPQYPSETPLVYTRTDAATDKLKYHIDGMEDNVEHGMISPATVVVYLSDGGSNLIFPSANDGAGVSITPKKGMAVTWFDMDEEYKPLMAAIHGVQATADFAEPRLAIQREYTLENSFFDVGGSENTN